LLYDCDVDVDTEFVVEADTELEVECDFRIVGDNPGDTVQLVEYDG
jgi:hypothetical protein